VSHRHTRKYLLALLVGASALTAGCYDSEFPATEDAGASGGTFGTGGAGGGDGTGGAAGGDAAGGGAGGGCDAPAPDDWQIDLTYSPSHLHPGVVATLNFAVSVAGEPGEGLSARVRYGLVGTTQRPSFPLKAGDVAGTYTGVRVLPDAGVYELFFEFTPCDEMVSRRFTLNIEGHP
jgi:hypothetical protein